MVRYPELGTQYPEGCVIEMARGLRSGNTRHRGLCLRQIKDARQTDEHSASAHRFGRKMNLSNDDKKRKQKKPPHATKRRKRLQEAKKAAEEFVQYQKDILKALRRKLMQ